jgi:nucleoside 2-deoxyribosyltransferase
MKIYIAAPYPLKKQAVHLKHRLESMGWTVTSRWLVEEQRGMSNDHARGDLEDVAAADVLLAFHPEEWHTRGTGGRHVEFGYALALGKQMVLLGQPTNNFHYLDYIRVIDCVEDL